MRKSIFGQLFFSSNTLMVSVDRIRGTFEVSVGNAIPNGVRTDMFISMGLASVTFLGYIVYSILKLNKRKKYRLEAEEWIAKNEKKLIRYANLVDSEQSDKIRRVFQLENNFKKNKKDN